jgi:ribonuclease P protein component
MSTFKKHERLCRKSFIDKLFAEGKSILVYPIKITALNVEFDNPTPAQAVFIAPKKRFKKANKRNLIKRRMREAYRIVKDDYYTSLANKNKQQILSISYVANDILSFDTIKKQLVKGLSLI